jgi:two-component system, chemotaxis family, protein-glutamate methylesterase/glutaminase
VQEPTDAGFASMPENALSQVQVDYVIPVREMGDVLSQLVAEGDSTSIAPASKTLEIENRIAKQENALQIGVTQLGPPTLYTCPECGGVLLNIDDGPILQFRCHTGHGFSVRKLLEEVEVKAENALWAALRTLEEGATLLTHMARRMREGKQSPHDAALVVEKAKDVMRRADMVRGVLYEPPVPRGDRPGDVDDQATSQRPSELKMSAVKTEGL